VVLIDAGGADLPALPSASVPGVRVIARPARGGYGVMQAEAVQAANGEIVAFLEEHAVALPGWLQGIVDVFAETGCVAASGEIHTLNAGNGISDAVAMMNYYQWLPPVTAYDAEILVGHNAVYSRQHLLDFGDDLPDLLDAEPVLQALLLDQGGRLRIDPRIRIAHQNEVTVRAIFRGYYLWNRSFGVHRVSHENWSILRRTWRIITIPLVPFVRIVRMTWSLARSARVPVAHVLRYWHAMFVAQCGAALGLAAGYLFGVGNAARQMGDYELDMDRGKVEPYHHD
jgi:hypothetical protein